jgi:hypothetical protein
MAALVSGCADVPLEGAGPGVNPTKPPGTTGSSHSPSTTPSTSPSHSPSVTPSPTPDPSTTLTPGVQAPAAAPVTRRFPAKLRNGKPPLFVVISFDGAGDLPLWAHWRSIAKQVNARMTFFLSGPYLYPQSRKTNYKPPYKKPGASDIGWGDPDKVQRRAVVLRQAIAEGHEIGTHANGHFCGKDGIDRWTGPQWTNELTAFDAMVRNGPTLAAGKTLAPPFDPSTVKRATGRRTGQ